MANTTVNPSTGTSISHVVVWGAGAMLLVILADFYPKLAIGLAGLLVASVLLINGTKYAGIITSYTSHA